MDTAETENHFDNPALELDEEIELNSETEDNVDVLSTEDTPSPEQKSFDLNHALEVAGFGRYHLFFMLVLGMMSFADASEIFLASIILKDLKCDFGLSAMEEAMVPAIVYLFYAVGSITTGKLSDIYGRKRVLLVGMSVLVVSAVLSAIAPTFILFLVCRGVTGFTIGANYGVSVVYFTEIVPVRHRSSAMLGMELFWTAGSLFECIVGWACMSRFGWRAQVGITVVPCALALIVLPFCDESARYYAISGQQDKAMRVITRMCRKNKQPVPEGQLKVTIEERGSILAVFSPQFRAQTFTLAAIFFINMFHVFAVIIILPDMLFQNYCSASSFLGSSTNDKGCEVLSKNDYWMLLVSSILTLPGFLMGSYLVEKIGRRKAFLYTAIVLTFTFILAFPCFGVWFLYVSLTLMIIASTAYNQILWIYTPESYPTYIRNTAVGTLNSIGKIGAATGTFLVETTDAKSIRGSLGLFLFLGIVLIGASALLRKETRNQALQDTTELEMTYANLQESAVI